MEQEARHSFTQGAPAANKKMPMLICGAVTAVFVVGGGIWWLVAGGYKCNATQVDFGCSSCENEETCTECTKGWEKDETLDGDKKLVSCTFPCTFDQIAAQATKCKNDKYILLCSEGYAAKDGVCNWQCDAAQQAAGCVECEHQTKCLKCKDGMKLFSPSDGETVCTYHCNDEQVKNKCVACDNSNPSALKCTHCSPGFGESNGRCVSECIAKGETDVSKPLNLSPEVRNGFEYPYMCVDEDVAHFFVLGDWGGAFKHGNYIYGTGAAGDNTHHKTFEYNVGGVDKQAQTLVAKAMMARAKTQKPRFIVNVGDSFYWGGFEETGCGGDPRKAFLDPRWQKVFLNIYDFPHYTDPTAQIPWLGTLGNHDYGGLHYDSGWDAQVYQTYKDDWNGRWRMPGLWWNQKVYWRTFMLELFFLDGNFVDAKQVGVDPSHNICNQAQGPSGGTCSGPGYDEVNYGNCFKWHYKNWADAIKWLEEKISASKAEWTGLVMHYPGNCGEPNIKAKMKTYGVDLCMVGHTHFQTMGQIMNRPDGAATCVNTQPCDAPLEIISGGGGGITTESKATPTNNMYGFVDMEMTQDTMVAKIVNQAGNENVYPIWTLPRRKKLARGETA